MRRAIFLVPMDEVKRALALPLTTEILTVVTAADGSGRRMMQVEITDAGLPELAAGALPPILHPKVTWDWQLSADPTGVEKIGRPAVGG